MEFGGGELQLTTRMDLAFALEHSMLGSNIFMWLRKVAGP